MGLPEETGLKKKKIENRKEKHISKNDHRKVNIHWMLNWMKVNIHSFIQSFIHEVPATCQALPGCPGPVMNKKAKGPVLLEFKQVWRR